MDLLGIGWPEIVAFCTVVAIDVALAGDNALVVGMAAAGLPTSQRSRAIIIGILAAAGLRIVFALFTVKLLAIVGLLLAGGILLLWVSWKLWREIRAQAAEASRQGEGASPAIPADKTMRQAVSQIILADVSMSLDNVLAVAGAARQHVWVLVLGLGLSVVLMGLAASLIARIIHRHRWISYVGLAIILWVALSMIWDGWHEVAPHLPQGLRSLGFVG